MDKDRDLPLLHPWPFRSQHDASESLHNATRYADPLHPPSRHASRDHHPEHHPAHYPAHSYPQLPQPRPMLLAHPGVMHPRPMLRVTETADDALGGSTWPGFRQYGSVADEPAILQILHETAVRCQSMFRQILQLILVGPGAAETTSLDSQLLLFCLSVVSVFVCSAVLSQHFRMFCSVALCIRYKLKVLHTHAVAFAAPPLPALCQSTNTCPNGVRNQLGLGRLFTVTDG